MTPTAAMATRIVVDAEHHITVDWAVVEYRLQNETWLVTGRCRLWHTVRLTSGVHLAACAMTDSVDIVTEGHSIQRALTQLMAAAWTQCLEGKQDDDTEH